MRTCSRATLGAMLSLGAALAACSHYPRPAAPVPSGAPAAAPTPAPTVPAVTATAAPAAPAPAPTPAPSAPAVTRGPYVLAGDWDWSAMLGDEPYSGTMTLQAQGTGFTGTLRVTDQFDGIVRSGTATGSSVRVVFDSPQGELVLEAVFTDANTLSGRVDVVSDGTSATFSAHRR
jgi:hypothetical protein